MFVFPTRLPWWLSGKESAHQCRKHEFDPWVKKIPWRRKWQSAPVFLSGILHAYRNLAGLGAWGHEESDTTEQQQQRQEGCYIHRRMKLGLPSRLPPPGAAPLDGVWEAGGPWGFPRLEQAAPLRCSGGGPDGNHCHLFLPGCGGNWSSDLPGAHSGQDTSLPGEGRDQIPGSQEEESFLIYIGKLMKASLGVPAL